MKELNVSDLNFFDITESDNCKVLELKKAIKDVIILDQGLYHIAICRSNISKIDGKNGKLYYRGKMIEEVMKEGDFIDVAFRLIFEEPYNLELKNNFKNGIYSYFYLSEDLKNVLDSIPEKVHPMNFLSIGILSLSAIEPENIKRSNDILEKFQFIIAQTAVIAIYYYLKLNQKEWKPIKSNGSISYRILNQMFKEDKNYKLTEFSEVLNKLLILHAEHEQNCSTATVRSVASAGTDVYSSISAGISAFKGRLHGGASQYVSEMYEDLLQNKIDVDEYITKKINNKERLMGFGHRIYNCWDPRAKIMFELLNSKDFNHPEINKYREIALKMVDRVSRDEFFKKRNIYPNPDLFNCIFYKLIGIPSEMNTVMLSLSRVVGWIAHYYEHTREQQPLMRPRQIEKLR